MSHSIAYYCSFLLLFNRCTELKCNNVSADDNTLSISELGSILNHISGRNLSMSHFNDSVIHSVTMAGIVALKRDLAQVSKLFHFPRDTYVIYSFFTHLKLVCPVWIYRSLNE